MGKFLPFIRRSHSFGWMYNGMVPIVICTPHMTSDTDYMYVGGGGGCYPFELRIWPFSECSNELFVSATLLNYRTEFCEDLY